MKRLLLICCFLSVLPFLMGYMSIGFMGGSSPVGGDNDFSADANCSALWKFESGALTTDSKGGNTLTNINTVAENTIDYKEGSCSADFERDSYQYLSITDADLDANYPLKSGDSNKKISVCGWFRMEELPDSVHEVIYSKYLTTSDKRSFLIFTSNIDNKLTLYIGYSNGTLYDTYTHASALSVGVWYHFGITWQDSDKSYRIRIWDDTASAIHGTDLTGTGDHNISITNAVVALGARSTNTRYWDGELDEVVVFKDILSTAEIDKIRAGTYP